MASDSKLAMEEMRQKLQQLQRSSSEQEQFAARLDKGTQLQLKELQDSRNYQKRVEHENKVANAC